MRRVIQRLGRAHRRDDGAMAILIAIVLTAVAIPVSAYGVTQLVRDGLRGELQRAADQGAVSGASMIPLADPTNLKTLAASNPTGVGSTAGLIPSGWCTKGPAELGSVVTSSGAGGSCPLDVACKAAMTSLDTDTAYGRHYATPYGVPSCSASYSDDSAFFTQLVSCVNGTAASFLGQSTVASLNSVLPSLLAVLPGHVTGLVPTTPLAYGSLLPALLKPGVNVKMSWLQRGPLDALNPVDDGNAHSMARYASATRAFKNVVVVPQVGSSETITVALTASLSALGVPIPLNAPAIPVGARVDITSPLTLNLNPTLVTFMSTVRSTLTSLNSLVGSGLPACSGLVTSMQTDLNDILDPQSTGAPSIGQVLTDAGASASPVLALMIPTNLTSALQIPFLDFVPMCLAQSGGVADITKGVVFNANSPLPPSLPSGVSSVGSCTLAAPGLFRGRLAS